jgi:2-acylglycerol O-acyltransferase 2
MIPRRKPITTVVGTPIEVTKLENPTNEQVEELHDKFVQALVALFDEYNSKAVSFLVEGGNDTFRSSESR